MKKQKQKETKMEQYYYNRLNKVQQNVYHAIKEGLLSLAPSFQIPRLEANELSDIYFMVRLDNPEIFYSVTYKYRYYTDSPNAEMIPEYMFDKNKIMEHRKAMKARIEKLALPVQKATDMEKLLYIHDFVCENVRYDKLKKPYSHEIIGALGHGVGVCEGIAKTVKSLCDRLGIWCMIAISGANPEKNIKYRHAWNIVCINHQYYHLDATFDNTLGKSEQIRYDYFLRSDKHFFRDHEPVIWKIPECKDDSLFYYKGKKLSFTKYEDVQKRGMQAAKKGKILTFHWRGGYMTKEVIKDILHILEEEATKKGKHAKVSLNFPQAVVRVAFDSEIVAEEVVIEEANEGESL